MGVYSTPEKQLGAEFTDRVYERSPEESYERVFDHLKELLPEAEEGIIMKLLK